MDSISRFSLNIGLMIVISVLLKIVTLYFPDYDSSDFTTELLPYTMTALFFLAAFLNPKGKCRKAELIMGCVGIVYSFLCYAVSTISWYSI